MGAYGYQRLDSTHARLRPLQGLVRTCQHPPQTPRSLAISLSLEASEVLEHFQWQPDLKDKDEFAGELATAQVTHVRFLDVGYRGWVAAGRPVTTGVQP